MSSAALDPELLALLGERVGVGHQSLRPWTHIVFDLGVDGEDASDLARAIEERFGFIATEKEWQQVASIEDLDGLVKRLRGRQRPEVAIQLSQEAGERRHRTRVTSAGLVAWCGMGVVLWLTLSVGFLVWCGAIILGSVVLGTRGVLEATKASRSWRRERHARYGV